MANAWHQPGLLEKANGSSLVSGHYDCVLRLSADDEGDHTVVTHGRLLMHAVGTVDGERFGCSAGLLWPHAWHRDRYGRWDGGERHGVDSSVD
jgi:hypothetical protein